MAQLSAPPDRPLLSVRDRQGPILRARGGHGRRGPSWLRRGIGGHKLNRRVRPVHGDHLPRWQAAQSGAAGAHPWLASAAERIGRPYQNSGNQALLPQPSDEDRAVVDDRRLAVLDAAARCSGERAGATRHLEVRDDAGAGTDGGGTVLVMRVNGNRA
jgi:hypothetical protein